MIGGVLKGLASKFLKSKIATGAHNRAIKSMMAGKARGLISSPVGIMNVSVGLVAPFVFNRDLPKEERGRRIAGDLALNVATFGFLGIGSLIAVNIGLIAMGGANAAGRGVIQGVKSGFDARTSLSVPFQHTTVGMQQAHVALQYSRNRVGSAYSSIGSEATFMHAKYMVR